MSRDQSFDARSGPPVLVIVGGAVASGKTTAARSLSALLGATPVSSDAWRAEIPEKGVLALARRVEERGFAELLDRVDVELSRGHSVVWDGCFALADERARARGVAVRNGALFLFVECRASEASLRARLAERDSKIEGGVRFWRQVHDAVARRFEPIAELTHDELEILPTDARDEAALAALAARLRERSPLPAELRAVTFDCWNTLIYESEWEIAHGLRVERLEEAAREAGSRVSRAEATRAFDAAWQGHMDLWLAGEASGAREVALWALAGVGLVEPHPAFEHLVRSFEEASHTGEVRALPGARETLEMLARAGVRCALVCDTGLTPGRVVRQHLARLGLLEGLAAQIFSDEVGVPKPDPKAFRAALDALGVRPEQALHVGDLRRTDVAGARALGMRSARIAARHDDTGPLRDADFVVASHGELRGLLSTLIPTEPHPPSGIGPGKPQRGLP